MKNSVVRTLALLLFVPLFLFSCQDGGTDAVESGTYQGSIKKIEAEKTEIYVSTDEGKVLELYFTDNTTLTRNGETVPFQEMQEGNRVEVEVEKVGQRLDPIAVRLLE